jgi:hypothetical protein
MTDIELIKVAYFDSLNEAESFWESGNHFKHFTFGDAALTLVHREDVLCELEGFESEGFNPEALIKEIKELPKGYLIAFRG